MKYSNETWKDIRGYEGYYLISNLGRIKSLSKKLFNGNGYFISKEKILMPFLAGAGYEYITLCKKGNKNKYLIHRLVAIHFVCNPKGLKEVNHKDGNKRNNNHRNLEWCSRGYNLKHARDMGLNNSIGVNNKMSKLDEQQVLEIRESKEKYSLLSIKYNVSISVISDVINFKSYKDVK